MRFKFRRKSPNLIILKRFLAFRGIALKSRFKKEKGKLTYNIVRNFHTFKIMNNFFYHFADDFRKTFKFVTKIQLQKFFDKEYI